jgi:hypothetical protein
MGGLFPILRHQNLQEAIITFNKNMGIAVRFLAIHIASYKAINSHNQFQGTTTYNRCCWGSPC